MQQKLPKILIIDTSTLIALERVGILDKLKYLEFQIIIPDSVFFESGIEKIKRMKNVKIEALKGKSVKKCKDLIIKGFGKGEAECLVLANKLRTGFIVCDDRKLIRQKYMLEDKIFKKINILGFSFILHLLVKRRYIKRKNIWNVFDNIIDKNNWKRGEVEISNYVFLKEIGY